MSADGAAREGAAGDGTAREGAAADDRARNRSAAERGQDQATARPGKGFRRMFRGTDKSTRTTAEAAEAAEVAGAHGTVAPAPAGGTRLAAEAVTLGYDQRIIAEDLSVAIPDRSFTVIVGPNACGKSTLLRALSRLLKPAEGRVLLDGRAIGALPAKAVARTLGLLPQSSVAPDGITVSGLVARGRYPHQGLLRQWSAEDERIVDESMAATGVAALADRYVDELSGGQRQRVWIAMALAQQTPLLLLDEPTTFLDIQHQIDVLDLCADLHEQRGRTLVAVLHDLNQAARYATHLIAMKDGRIEAQGPPAEIITTELVERVFGVRCRIIDDPESGTPLVVPAARRAPGKTDAERDDAERADTEHVDTEQDGAATAASAASARPAGSPAP